MEAESLQTAGVILITVPAVEFGGISLLKFLKRRSEGYLDNPLRRALFRAGHAHAGVMVVLALVGLLYVDSTSLSEGARSLVRICLVIPPVTMPAGFFFSIASPRATRPNALIWLVYVGAAALAVGAVTLGVGLIS